ncbi:hypothetical protein PIB30_005606 [Stylosanthes scabra]|uniref:Uncharacterized protein n=1 Tax=Stylosanthes scabra TaxID=79078 RepID=A0ABU6S4I6_9FABA|nr:hypothetical protein [Stylosanthes scabra]
MRFCSGFIFYLFILTKMRFQETLLSSVFVVESYNLICDNWKLCPSLNKNKGSLFGAVLDKKIFAVGGGNGVECFSDVEMLDFDIGRWNTTQSILEKVKCLGKNFRS